MDERRRKDDPMTNAEFRMTSFSDEILVLTDNESTVDQSEQISHRVERRFDRDVSLRWEEDIEWQRSIAHVKVSIVDNSDRNETFTEEKNKILSLSFSTSFSIRSYEKLLSNQSDSAKPNTPMHCDWLVKFSSWISRVFPWLSDFFGNSISKRIFHCSDVIRNKGARSQRIMNANCSRYSQ